MSLFLGKVHYWLFAKIEWFEALEEEILAASNLKGIDVEGLRTKVYEEFGVPTEKKPLEDMIDQGNIHGWLQGKIESAEARQAAFVTAILNEKPELKKDLIEVFQVQGEKAGKLLNEKAIPNSPIGLFNAMNDFVLDGMPCDRVNNVVNEDENEILWETTQCLHSVHWERINGDVKNFYDLRETWIKAFVSNVNSKFKFEKVSGNTQKIAKI